MTLAPKWTQDEEAQQLLAQCVSNRPAFRRHVERYGNAVEVTHLFTGPAVKRLGAIRSRYMTEALAAGDASGNHDQFKVECLSVDEAIESAISASRIASDISRHGPPVGRMAQEAVRQLRGEKRA